MSIAPTISVTNASPAHARVCLQRIRADVPHVEPHSLGAHIELGPGEQVLLTLHPGEVIAIGEPPAAAGESPDAAPRAERQRAFGTRLDTALDLARADPETHDRAA